MADAAAAADEEEDLTSLQAVVVCTVHSPDGVLAGFYHHSLEVALATSNCDYPSLPVPVRLHVPVNCRQ